MLRQHRWPWEDEPLRSAALEARISLVLTMGCGVSHFLTAYHFKSPICFWIHCDPTSVTVVFVFGTVPIVYAVGDNMV